MEKVSRQFIQLLTNQSVTAKTVPPVDGEILYCKNNVCIHPPGLLANSITHHSGFLSISAKVNETSTSLMLSWKPSKTFSKSTEEDKNNTVPEISGQIDTIQDENNVEDLPSPSSSSATSEYKSVSPSDTVTSFSDIEQDTNEETKAENINHTGTVNEHDSTLDSSRNSADLSKSPLAIHNFQFPENSIQFQKKTASYNGHVIRPPKDQAFGAFAVDLAEMRSLRMFFSNDNCTNGELVIASKESQYKVLHFHCGGLDCIYAVLKEWKANIKQAQRADEELSINHFSYIRPQLTNEERHPEEGLYRGLTVDTWMLYTDEFGRVQNEQNIQKAVFFGGVEKQLRAEVWPFLLKYYNLNTTVTERDEIRMERYHKYVAINCEREALLNVEEVDDFLKNVACSVEKDVLRTDRANPFYQGEGNPNLDTLERILLNYSVYTKTSYTQGMSDLLSPLLIEIKEESDVFWCFVGLMQRTIFISSPSDADMEKQLLYLRELLRLLVPAFYKHLLTCGPGALELLFAHRWILLCFKREFTECEALMIWESCWAHYQTNYFHLFICVAIISLYGADVADLKLASDEMLLHFSHLSMQMNGSLVLRKARGLLHSMLSSNSIPCTLHDLFCLPVTHDSTQIPKVKCNGGNECAGSCVHGGEVHRNPMKKFNLGRFF
uniref:TBC1 domain family member 16-like n=1 Tax=Phallusia mammillata TaxID=59560 RepID=A0A6F9DUL4_9ASCI|nr:TBC1 domain family member 16-like [Phallusia mammillata]